MGFLSERKRGKKLGDFIGHAMAHGGSFITTATPETVIGWLADAPQVQVIARDSNAVSVHPVFKSGTVGSEVVAVRAQPTETGTKVIISLEGVNDSPTHLNMTALGPVSALLTKLDETDPTWRRA